ncbi:MAG: hypothetical protein EBY39_06245 [Flavobacteriia bacterium]|nr:hypothetical protein [Flavobacteriia bacterium]
MPRTKKIDNSSGPSSYKRDENGLLENIEYHFNEDGSVDWRSMIKEDHLFPNKSWFELRKKDTPRSIEGLKDHQLLIKLSGIKELARLRGFESVSFETVKCEMDHVAVKCCIVFIANYETPERVIYEDMANATLNNTSSFATKFLETIACNRAFVRCVRNFLNVHIVGDDEIDKSDNNSKQSSQSNDLSPAGVLKKELLEKHGISSYEDFLPKLRELHKSGKISISTDIIKTWSDFSDISAKECRILIGVLKS